jgi:hypothetical protein
MKITKDKSTPEKRAFWESIEKINLGVPGEIRKQRLRNLPPLGDTWWKAETELTFRNPDHN